MIAEQEELLELARQGKTKAFETFMQSFTGDINMKGTRKKNLGWSALHLASYFGHEGIVKTLLEHGADVDLLNSTGDTALHKAVISNRTVSVTFLFHFIIVNH